MVKEKVVFELTESSRMSKRTIRHIQMKRCKCSKNKKKQLLIANQATKHASDELNQKVTTGKVSDQVT